MSLSAAGPRLGRLTVHHCAVLGANNCGHSRPRRRCANCPGIPAHNRVYRMPRCSADTQALPMPLAIVSTRDRRMAVCADSSRLVRTIAESEEWPSAGVSKKEAAERAQAQQQAWSPAWSHALPQPGKAQCTAAPGAPQAGAPQPAPPASGQPQPGQQGRAGQGRSQQPAPPAPHLQAGPQASPHGRG